MSSLLRSPLCNISLPPGLHSLVPPHTEKNRSFLVASPRPLLHLSEKNGRSSLPSIPSVGHGSAYIITYNKEGETQIQDGKTETEEGMHEEVALESEGKLLSEEIIRKESQLFVPTYSRFPVVFAKGYGCKLYDVEGKEYIDMCAGIAVNALGHGDKAWVNSITEQASLLSHVSNVYHSKPQVQLAERLLGSCFADRIFFCNSGTEANEAAIKFARKYQRAKLKEKNIGSKGYKSEQGTEAATGFVAFSNSFHGRTLGSLALTSKEKYREPFEPIMPGVKFVDFGDLEAARKAIQPGRTAAVFVEPVQGEGGIYPAMLSFLRGLRERCNETGALLIFDEVQCGLGRTGLLWAYEHFGVMPDIMTVAKPLAGGLPIGAVLVTEAVSSAIEYGDHGSTFAGGPLVCHAALAVLDRIQEPGFLETVTTKGQFLRGLLTEKLGCNPHVKEVRGLGLLVGVELDVPAGPLVKAVLEHGLLVLTAGKGNIVRLVPPLVITEEEIKQGVEILSQYMPVLDS